MKNKTKKGQLPPCKYPNAQFSPNSGRKEFNMWPNAPPTPSGRKIDWYWRLDKIIDTITNEDSVEIFKE